MNLMLQRNSLTEWMINDIIIGQMEIWCRNDNVKSNWYMVPRKERGKKLGLVIGRASVPKMAQAGLPNRGVGWILAMAWKLGCFTEKVP